MLKRGQGAFEYVLLVAGVLLIVALTFIILRSTLFAGKQGIESNLGVFNSLTCLPTYMGERPAHWWKFDEGVGATAKDSTGGSDGVMTVHGNAPNPYWVPGISGNGIHLETGAGFDYASVDVPRDESLYLNERSFTIEAWIHPLAPHAGGSASFVALVDEYILGSVDGKLAGAIVGVTGTALVGNTVISINQWHHIALTYDFDADTVSLYLDGMQDATQAYPGTDWIPDHNENYPFNVLFDGFDIGDVDQVVLYSRALSPEEVKADYACVQNTA
ncbi:LamG domain-containing protein [Candidatus Micrarchaeota archaeon]|nr:LamG domain-containing protein [Candidatus Micrarchaeota archaeon]